MIKFKNYTLEARSRNDMTIIQLRSNKTGDIVTGSVVLFNEGDYVPKDYLLWEAINILMDTIVEKLKYSHAKDILGYAKELKIVRMIKDSAEYETLCDNQLKLEVY